MEEKAPNGQAMALGEDGASRMRILMHRMYLTATTPHDRDSTRMCELILAYTLGKPKETVELQVPDGSVSTVNLNFLSVEQLTQLNTVLIQAAGGQGIIDAESKPVETTENTSDDQREAPPT